MVSFRVDEQVSRSPVAIFRRRISLRLKQALKKVKWRIESEATLATSLHLESSLHFLDELNQNNNKVWFDAHRPAYESTRKTFEQFINDLIDEYRISDRLQDLSARECIARIYRDIRFSKNKSPYKNN
jgi:hypothetical protein